MDKIVERYTVEGRESWHEWIEKIPAINFPADWSIKIIPPFGGAIARFWVECGTAHVSVYLEVFGRLGFFDGPYWELYPYEEDIYRVGINETEELLKRIQESITQQMTTD